jgi:hypothetical protein
LSFDEDILALLAWQLFWLLYKKLGNFFQSFGHPVFKPYFFINMLGDGLVRTSCCLNDRKAINTCPQHPGQNFLKLHLTFGDKLERLAM